MEQINLTQLKSYQEQDNKVSITEVLNYLKNNGYQDEYMKLDYQIDHSTYEYQPIEIIYKIISKRVHKP